MSDKHEIFHTPELRCKSSTGLFFFLIFKLSVPQSFKKTALSCFAAEGRTNDRVRAFCCRYRAIALLINCVSLLADLCLF